MTRPPGRTCRPRACATCLAAGASSQSMWSIRITCTQCLNQFVNRASHHTWCLRMMCTHCLSDHGVSFNMTRKLHDEHCADLPQSVLLLQPVVGTSPASCTAGSRAHECHAATRASMQTQLCSGQRARLAVLAGIELLHEGGGVDLQPVDGPRLEHRKVLRLQVGRAVVPGEAACTATGQVDLVLCQDVPRDTLCGAWHAAAAMAQALQADALVRGSCMQKWQYLFNLVSWQLVDQASGLRLGQIGWQLL